jgi:ERCC4-related helicase
MTASPASGSTFEDTCEAVLKLCRNLNCQIASPATENEALQAVLSPPAIEYVAVDQLAEYPLFEKLWGTYLQDLHLILKRDLELADPFFELKEWAKVLTNVSKCREHIDLCLSCKTIANDQEKRLVLDHMRSLYETHDEIAGHMSLPVGVNAMKQCMDKLCETWGSIQLPPGSTLGKKLLDIVHSSDLYTKVRDGAFEQLKDGTTPRTRRLLEYLRDSYLPKWCASDKLIVFVQTRDTAKIIADLICKTFEGRLVASCIVGHGKNGEGMDHQEQELVASRFRMDHQEQFAINALVGTTVVEEGLDIPSCNTVIRYSDVTTLTGFIQSRGRARAKNSRFVIFHDAEASKTGQAEIADLQRRECDMNRAVRMIMSGDLKLTDMLELLSDRGARQFMQCDAIPILLQVCPYIAILPRCECIRPCPCIH